MLHIQLTPKSKCLFAWVSGVDLKEPIEDRVFDEINRALLAYGVLLFRGQYLSDEQQVVFCKNFGPLEYDLFNPSQHIAKMSNVHGNGSLIDPENRLQLFMKANQQWHSDSTFLPAPARQSFLSCHKTPPEGGETEFADMKAAYQALPMQLQQELDGLIVQHDFQRSRHKTGHEFTQEERTKWPPLSHPLVRIHEETGEKILYVGSQANKVIGRSMEEGTILLEQLREWCSKKEFVYSHSWQVGDFVVWDNRRVNHRGRPWDANKYARILHRTTVRGTGPTIENGRPVDELARWRMKHGDDITKTGVVQNRVYMMGDRYRKAAALVSVAFLATALAAVVWLGTG